MMKFTMNKKIKMLGGLFLLAIGFTACQKNETGSGTTQLQVRMTDAPGDFEEINLNVKNIVVKVNDTASTPYILEANKQFNVLDFRLGTAKPDILLASEEVPTGEIKEVRLVLNESGNTIKVGGQLYDLKIPSGYSSGWKIKLTETPSLNPGIAYSLVLDFDAAKSIVKTGNGKFLLKPVVRGITVATSGILTGTIAPATVQTKVFAINATNDTVGTLSNTTSGYFSIGGLRAGNYKLAFDAIDSTYSDTTINSVAIDAGKTTALGTITLKKK